MKINELLEENARHDDFSFNQGGAVEAQLRIVRDFLRQTPDPEVMSIYKQAVADKYFDPRDLERLREVLRSNGVNRHDVSRLV